MFLNIKDRHVIFITLSEVRDTGETVYALVLAVDSGEEVAFYGSAKNVSLEDLNLMVKRYNNLGCL